MKGFCLKCNDWQDIKKGHECVVCGSFASFKRPIGDRIKVIKKYIPLHLTVNYYGQPESIYVDCQKSLPDVIILKEV